MKRGTYILAAGVIIAAAAAAGALILARDDGTRRQAPLPASFERSESSGTRRDRSDVAFESSLGEGAVLPRARVLGEAPSNALQFLPDQHTDFILSVSVEPTDSRDAAGHGDDAEVADAHASEPALAGTAPSGDAPADAVGPARIDPTSDDLRLQVRWGQEALCASGEAPPIDRRQLHATFVATTLGAWTIFRAPSVSDEQAHAARATLDAARNEVGQMLSARVGAPRVFLYADVDQLVDSACVNRAARGYYDGAIHAAGDYELQETLSHEYVHHALLELGVAKPMWLHEGLAMLVADEIWWSDDRLGLRAWLVRSRLPFDALVNAFPHTSDELFAGAAFYQSYAMARFVLARGQMPLPKLVGALSGGTLAPRDAFTAAAGLEGEALDAAFAAFAGAL